VAIWSHHGVLIAPRQRGRYNSWRANPSELISEANQKDVRFGKLFLASGAASAQSEITKSDPKNSKADT